MFRKSLSTKVRKIFLKVRNIFIGDWWKICEYLQLESEVFINLQRLRIIQAREGNNENSFLFIFVISRAS